MHLRLVFASMACLVLMIAGPTARAASYAYTFTGTLDATGDPFTCRLQFHDVAGVLDYSTPYGRSVYYPDAITQFSFDAGSGHFDASPAYSTFNRIYVQYSSDPDYGTESRIIFRLSDRVTILSLLLFGPGDGGSPACPLPTDNLALGEFPFHFGGQFLDPVVSGSLTALSLVSSAPPHLTGDTNNDNVVDLTDLNNVLNNFGAAGSGNAGDENNDNLVDLSDLNNVLNNFGAHPAAASLAVPEPAFLAACGLAFLPLLRRRTAE